MPSRHLGTARGRRTGGVRRPLTAAALVGLLLSGAAGCNSPQQQQPPAPLGPALRLQTVHGAFHLRPGARAVLESAVGDALSDYVVGAFLGTYPRDDFVQAFDGFTAGAAREALRKIDLLTARKYRTARSVTAEDLSARLSFVLLGDTAVGVAAHVRFRFSAEYDDGRTESFSLVGRLLLVHEQSAWLIFGWDVGRSDLPSQTGEVVP
jgi:hypothetical protein